MKPHTVTHKVKEKSKKRLTESGFSIKIESKVTKR